MHRRKMTALFSGLAGSLFGWIGPGRFFRAAEAAGTMGGMIGPMMGGKV